MTLHENHLGPESDLCPESDYTVAPRSSDRSFRHFREPQDPLKGIFVFIWRVGEKVLFGGFSLVHIHINLMVMMYLARDFGLAQSSVEDSC